MVKPTCEISDKYFIVREPDSLVGHLNDRHKLFLSLENS